MPMGSGTMTQDSQQLAGAGGAPSDCGHWEICLGSLVMLGAHMGKTERNR